MFNVYKVSTISLQIIYSNINRHFSSTTFRFLAIAKRRTIVLMMEQNMRSMLIVVNVIYNTRGLRGGGVKGDLATLDFLVSKNIILCCGNVFFFHLVRTWQICSLQDCFVKFNLERNASQNNFSSKSPRNPRLSHVIQGVPRIMTVERLLEYRL